MAHILSPEAEAELDGIWYYIAKESGNPDIADRFIDSLTARFYLLAFHPHTCSPSIPILDAAVTMTCVPQCAAFPWASTSSSIALKRETCESCMSCAVAGT